MKSIVTCICFLLLVLIIPCAYADETSDFLIEETGIDTCTIVKYLGESEYVEIPEKINNQTVTTIGEGAFEDCRQIKEIVLPNTISDIEWHAFYNCFLTEIKFSENLKRLAPGAFEECGYLKKIELPEGVTTVGYGAFMGCFSLEEVELPSTLKEISTEVFRRCFSLTTIKFKEGLRKIDGSAFFSCIKLKEVYLPNGLEFIGGRAFEDCSELEIITIPESVEMLAPNAFYACDKLTVHVVKGSYAEGILKENGIPCVTDDSLAVEDLQLDFSDGEKEAENFSFIFPDWSNNNESEISPSTNFVKGKQNESNNTENESPNENTITEQDEAFSFDRPQIDKTQQSSLISNDGSGSKEQISEADNTVTQPKQNESKEMDQQELTSQKSRNDINNQVTIETNLNSMQQKKQSEEEINECTEMIGYTAGTTGNQITVSLTIKKNIVVDVLIFDREETQKMRVGYDLAAGIMVNETITSLSQLTKKEFVKKLQEQAKKTGNNLTSGGADLDSALNTFQAMKNAIR